MFMIPIIGMLLLKILSKSSFRHFAYENIKNIFVINIEFMIGNDLSNYVNYLAAGWSSYRLAS